MGSCDGAKRACALYNHEPDGGFAGGRGLALKLSRTRAFGSGIGRSLRMSIARATVSVLVGEFPKGPCFMIASRLADAQAAP